jgi:dTDP-4-dehydrorhamnose 3,5-epimerase
MKKIVCPLEGVIAIQPDVFEDSRGHFTETWNKKRYEEVGLVEEFVQDNLSFSKKGVLRGLHFQNPKPQAKLVTVLRGEVYDVVLDVRIGSPTFGNWYGFLLNELNKMQIYVPVGFAHGFIVRSDVALFHYKCSEYYFPQNEITLKWNDPAIGIRWGDERPLTSLRDESGKHLSEVPPERLFRM